MNLENEILQLCFDVLEKEMTPLQAQKEILRLFDVVGRSEQLRALLIKLLENNMCSHAGDELIEEALKGF